MASFAVHCCLLLFVDCLILLLEVVVVIVVGICKKYYDHFGFYITWVARQSLLTSRIGVQAHV